MASLFGGFPSSIRSGRFGAFPQVNIGATDDSIEIVAFAPGVDAGRARCVDRQRAADDQPASASPARASVTPMTDPRRHRAPMRRSASPARFRRVIELPQNADPDKVQARYTNGCLSITVGKREASKPRAITVQ